MLGTPETSLSYDSNGLVAGLRKGNRVMSLNYDALARVTGISEKSVPGSAPKKIVSLSYDLDAGSRGSTLVSVSRFGKVADEFKYDIFGREETHTRKVKRFIIPWRKTLRKQYDSMGRMEKLTLDSGISSLLSTTDRSYRCSG